jgi:hypothetical protein
MISNLKELIKANEELELHKKNFEILVDERTIDLQNSLGENCD